MKIAVIGNGKTGSKVVELINPQNLIGPFGKTRPAQLPDLTQADAIISFVPGDAFLDLIPLLIECKKPVITGATGFDWPIDIESQLKKANLKWLYSSNFSMGVQLLRPLLQLFSTLAPQYLPSGNFSMSEAHHIHKKDAPSGTALTLKNWLGVELQIESIREGDIVGDHLVKFSTPYEQITLRHEAFDRKLFASGAIWAAEQFYQNNTLSSGLYSLEQFLVSKGAQL